LNNFDLAIFPTTGPHRISFQRHRVPHRAGDTADFQVHGVDLNP